MVRDSDFSRMLGFTEFRPDLTVLQGGVETRVLSDHVAEVRLPGRNLAGASIA